MNDLFSGRSTKALTPWIQPSVYGLLMQQYKEYQNNSTIHYNKDVTTTPFPINTTCAIKNTDRSCTQIPHNNNQLHLTSKPVLVLSMRECYVEKRHTEGTDTTSRCDGSSNGDSSSLVQLILLISDGSTSIVAVTTPPRERQHFEHLLSNQKLKTRGCAVRIHNWEIVYPNPTIQNCVDQQQQDVSASGSSTNSACGPKGDDPAITTAQSMLHSTIAKTCTTTTGSTTTNDTMQQLCWTKQCLDYTKHVVYMHIHGTIDFLGIQGVAQNPIPVWEDTDVLRVLMALHEQQQLQLQNSVATSSMTTTMENAKDTFPMGDVEALFMSTGSDPSNEPVATDFFMTQHISTTTPRAATDESTTDTMVHSPNPTNALSTHTVQCHGSVSTDLPIGNVADLFALPQWDDKRIDEIRIAARVEQDNVFPNTMLSKRNFIDATERPTEPSVTALLRPPQSVLHNIDASVSRSVRVEEKHQDGMAGGAISAKIQAEQDLERAIVEKDIVDEENDDAEKEDEVNWGVSSMLIDSEEEEGEGKALSQQEQSSDQDISVEICTYMDNQLFDQDNEQKLVQKYTDNYQEDKQINKEVNVCDSRMRPTMSSFVTVPAIPLETNEFVSTMDRWLQIAKEETEKATPPPPPLLNPSNTIHFGGDRIRSYLMN